MALYKFDFNFNLVMREDKCLNVVLKARWWQNSVFEWI